ncbi:hypothetical protein ACXET9_07055 [Brachybacterium sp. DNPG3]
MSSPSTTAPRPIPAGRPPARGITISSTAAIIIAVGTIAAGILLGGGAFLGGHVLGERSAGAASAAAAEEEAGELVFTAADLDAAVVACGIDDVQTDADGVLTLPGTVYPSFSRQCVLLELDPPARAWAEYSYDGFTSAGATLDGGEYSWGNLTMRWTQVEGGRDMTLELS